MGLYRYAPVPSGRMGALWTVAAVQGAAVLEFGSMGHMLYAQRWLWQSAPDHKSRIYTTHLDEKDIALGITKRFSLAIKEIIDKEKPEVIFVLPSAVPEITGMDMESLCEETEADTGIKIVMLKKGSFHEKLHHGIEEGLYRLVKELAVGRRANKTVDKTDRITCNLIGSCIDTAKFQADVYELQRILKAALDMEVLCVLSSETSVRQIEDMGGAHINLVLRREGIKAADTLKAAFQTDYVYGRPYGYQGTVSWLEEIAKKLELTLNREFLDQEIDEGSHTFDYCRQLAAMLPGKALISAGGNYDVVKGILDFAVKEAGFKKKYVWCDVKDYGDAFIPYQAEEDRIKNITKDLTGILMADKTAYQMAGRKSGPVINRSLNNRNFNKYESPYVGFRGAMNLCALWLEELL